MCNLSCCIVFKGQLLVLYSLAVSAHLVHWNLSVLLFWAKCKKINTFLVMACVNVDWFSKSDSFNDRFPRELAVCLWQKLWHGVHCTLYIAMSNIYHWHSLHSTHVPWYMYGSDVCVSRTLHLRAYRHRRTQHPANTRHADVSCVIDDVTGGGDVVDDVTVVDDVVNSGNDATAGVCDDVLLRVLSLLNVRDLTRCQRGECDRVSVL